MKKTYRVFLIFLILLFALIPVFSYAQQGKESPQNMAVNSPGESKTNKKKLKAAGMDVYIKYPFKHHSIPAHLKMPFVRKGYHNAVVHLDPYRNGIISAHIRDPFVVEDHMGFKFTVNNAVYHKETDSFVGHGEIEGLHLPGKLYANHIRFNKRGIIEVDKLRSRTCSRCRVANFPFTAEEIKWTDKGIESKGLLNLRKTHVDVNLLITPREVKVLKLNENANVIVENRIATITGIKIKNNQLYVSGKAPVFNGTFHHFKNVPVGPTGFMRLNIPKARRPKPFPVNREKQGRLGRRRPKLKKTRVTLSEINGSLPGTKMVKIKDTNMMMTITSAGTENGKTVLAGYVTLPSVIGRVNIFSGKLNNAGDEVDLSDANMYWEKKKYKDLISGDYVELDDKVTLEEDEQAETKKFSSKAVGTLHIKEVHASLYQVLVDNETVNYTVYPGAVSDVVLRSIGKFTDYFMDTELLKFQFLVIQGDGWRGFRFQGNIGHIKMGPKKTTWFSRPVWEGPSFFIEVHSDGYVKLDAEGGSSAEIEIIPGLVKLEDPEFHFLRDPGLCTELNVRGTLIIIKKDLCRLIVEYFVDVTGMYPSAGEAKTVWLFDLKVGELVTAYSAGDWSVTIQGELELFGYKFAEGNSRVALKGKDFFKGSAAIKIPYPCHCHWSWKPPFLHCKTCHKWVGIKVKIKRNAHLSIGFGRYDFKMPKGSKGARYSGPFKVDGITYNGVLIIDNEKGITATGTSDKIKGSAGNDTASATLSVDGNWMNDEMCKGTLYGSIDLELQPNLPRAKDVDLKYSFKLHDESGKRRFLKNPSTGNWKIVPSDENVEVKFQYKDKNGDTQQFDQNCPLRMTLYENTLHVDLDLPSEFGGTYSQSFNMK